MSVAICIAAAIQHFLLLPKYIEAHIDVNTIAIGKLSIEGYFQRMPLFPLFVDDPISKSDSTIRLVHFKHRMGIHAAPLFSITTEDHIVEKRSDMYIIGRVAFSRPNGFFFLPDVNVYILTLQELLKSDYKNCLIYNSNIGRIKYFGRDKRNFLRDNAQDINRTPVSVEIDISDSKLFRVVFSQKSFLNSFRFFNGTLQFGHALVNGNFIERIDILFVSYILFVLNFLTADSSESLQASFRFMKYFFHVREVAYEYRGGTLIKGIYDNRGCFAPLSATKSQSIVDCADLRKYDIYNMHCSISQR